MTRRRFDGIGREGLQQIADAAIERCDKLEALNRQLNENLTSVQARCTTLLGRRRAWQTMSAPTAVRDALVRYGEHDR